MAGEEVGPWIQGELEKLNQFTDAINRQETEPENTHHKFLLVLVETTVKLDELVRKIGKSLEDWKFYWEAWSGAWEQQAQKATQDVQRATDMLCAVKVTSSY
ncbi:SH3 domain-binding protein 5 [Sciurus carolinensis]|uniref:SH3 domain-binding protein 5 n=1 Tax=Sciurus carolinensis TaxID=30640 RepID=A0AA41MJU8_SCICA|nr:SH3 domain-binding protein 5 [Sciurus carolinensis]